MSRYLTGSAVSAFIILAVGCVGGPDDRCYLHDIEYRAVRRAFERTQSLEVVKEGLRDAHWPECKYNEAIYRIEKEFGLNDPLPSPRRIRTEEQLKIEEEADRMVSGGFSGLKFSP